MITPNEPAPWPDPQVPQPRHGRLPKAGEQPTEPQKHESAEGFPAKPHSLLRQADDYVWNGLFARLMEFYLRCGHLDIPRTIGNSTKLWDWADAQRQAYQNGTLKPERRQRLEAVGFIWSPAEPGTPGGEVPASDFPMEENPKGNGPDGDHLIEAVPSDSPTSWDIKYVDLVSFHQRFGHCYVPYPWPEQPGLAYWVQAQRQQRATLSAEQIARLDALHFYWSGGWEVLGDNWRQKEKEVMGRFYRDPAKPRDDFSLYPRPPIWFDEEDFESS